LLDFLLHAKPDAFEIERDLTVEFGFTILCRTSDISENRSIVKGAVNATEALDRLSYQSFDIFGPGDIGLKEKNLTTLGLQSSSNLLAAMGSASREHNACSVVRKQFAQQQRITPDEAAIWLIERGLSLGKPVPKVSPVRGLGLFSSAEDSAIIDEAVAIAYEERRHSSKSEKTL
jgi:hypothetical protein